MSKKRIKKTTLDCAIDWVQVHGWDFWQQFSAREWHLAELAVSAMRNGYNYRAAVKWAYDHEEGEDTK